MTTGRRAAALLLLAAALGLAALGQFYFSHRREFLWDGAVLHALAILCFLLAWRQIRPGKAPAQAAGLRLERGRWPAQAILLAAGLFFTFIATLLSMGRAPDQNMSDAVFLWLIGVVCALAAAFWPLSVAQHRLRWPPHLSRQVWLEIAAVAGLTILALMLRVTALDSVPWTLGGDEAWHGLLARQVLHGELRNPFTMGYMSMPTFFYWPMSWALRLVDNGMIGIRLPAALVGTATIPLFYGLVRSLWDRRTAFLSAAFMATYDYHIHYSRLSANNIWDPLFVILTMWALDRALVEGDPAGGDGEQGRTGLDPSRARYAILAGVAIGLGYYFYTGARLLPILVVVYALFVWLQRRRACPRAPSGASGASVGELIRPLALVAVVIVIVAGPILSFALSHPGEWNARVNQIGIIQSGWLEREPELTGKSVPRLLAEQFLRSAGAFHVYADKTVWYGADRPLLGFLAGALALLGMAWAFAHWRERRHFLVLIWFWGVILSGGMLTDSPPASQRLVMAIPAVCLLVTVGLEQTVNLAGRLLDAHPFAQNAALGIIIVALAAGNTSYYFNNLIPSGRYGSENGETATMIGHYLHDVEDGAQVYFLGPPRIYWGFGTMAFLAPQVEGHDVKEPLTAPPSLPETGQQIVFVALPERAGELAWVEQAFPTGQKREFLDAEGKPRFVAYEASP